MIKNILFVLLFTTTQTFAQNNFIGKGTTVAIIVRGDTIWAGADSKILFEDPTGMNPNKYSLDACKIQKFDDIVYTHSGIYMDDQNHILAESIKKIFDEDGTLNEKLSKSDSYTTELLNNITFKYKNINYEALATNNIFLYFENDSAKVLIYEYTVEKIFLKNSILSLFKSESEVKLKILKINLSPKFQYYISGIKDEGISYIKNNSEFVKGYPPSYTIKQIINLETKAGPQFVGGKVDIIRLTKDDIDWIQCKDNCKN